jgi:hypothetical protein
MADPNHHNTTSRFIAAFLCLMLDLWNNVALYWDQLHRRTDMATQISKQFFKDTIKKIGRSWGASYLVGNDFTELKGFSGDEMVVAFAFQKALRYWMQHGEGHITPNKLANARSTAYRGLCKPAPKITVDPCTRCNGTGMMPFKHVEKGVCFKCGGTGKNK